MRDLRYPPPVVRRSGESFCRARITGSRLRLSRAWPCAIGLRMPVRAALEFEHPWEKVMGYGLDLRSLVAFTLSVLLAYAMKRWVYSWNISDPPEVENQGPEEGWILIEESHKFHITNSGSAVHLFTKCGSLKGKKYSTLKVCGHCLEIYRNRAGTPTDDETN